MEEGNQPQDVAELERITNEAEGWEMETSKEEQEPETPQAQTNETPEQVEPQKVAPEAPAPVESKSAEAPVDDVIQKVSKETPYKTVDDLINGYKSSQSEVTKYIERVKPYEQLINDLHQDQNLKQFVDQAVQLYRNPSLAQQYVQPQQQQQSVNPANFDLYTPEGQIAYQQAVEQAAEEKAQKIAFETVNQRMSGWEQQQALEKAKLEFKQKYPDQNPDDVLKFVQERKNNWTLEDAYKIANYDKVNEQAYERARKDVQTKLNEASKNQSTASPASAPEVSPTEIVSHINRHGIASANKKWGQEKVTKVIQEFTNDNES